MVQIAIDLRMLNSSGIGVYLKNLIPKIIERKPEYSFILLGFREELQSLFDESNRVKILSFTRPIYSFIGQFSILRKIPRNVDLFWVPHFNAPVFYRRKLLVTIHDMFHMAMPDYLGAFYKKAYAKLLLKFARKNAQAILTVSQFSKREILKFLGGFEDNIFVTYPGIAKEWGSIHPGEKLHDKPYILFIGNIKPHKNLKNLIKAFLSLCDQIDHDLIVVGQERGLLTPDSEVLNLLEMGHDRISFKGFVDLKTLQRYVKQASCFIFPSLYEGFGLPLLEAMACSVPVACSDRASIPEVGENAVLYFDPVNYQDIAKKIITLITDMGLRSELVSKGNEQVNKFSWEECATQTIRVIDKILAIP